MNDYLIKLQSSFIEIKDEIERAKSKYPKDFNSYHEAFGVIKEEFDETWDEIKKKDIDKDKLRKEAIQTAAMVCRMLVELL